MAEPLTYITNLTIILTLGIILTIISRKLKISNLLLLVLCGIVLNRIRTETFSIEFDPVFLTAISLLALVMIVFDSCSKFKLKELDEFSILAIKATVIWLVLNMIVITFALVFLFDSISILVALMFASLMSGTAPSAILVMFKGSEHRIGKFLEIESIVNTPIIVLLPFIILDFMGSFSQERILSGFIEQIGPFLQQFVAGVGAGILVGIVVFRIMSTRYEEIKSPLSIMTAAILTYILAENLGGNGVLAVTTIGFFFGTFFRRGKESLTEFASLFANTLVILVFVLIGLEVGIPLTGDFILKSVILFLAYLIVRFIAITLSFRHLKYSIKEKLFVALNAQKGIALATVAFTLTTMAVTMLQTVEGAEQLVTLPFIELQGAKDILALIIAFIVYSLVISTIMQRLSKFFLGEIIVPQPLQPEGPAQAVKKKGEADAKKISGKPLKEQLKKIATKTAEEHKKND